MALTTCKETALRAFVNTWLKDPQPYCNNCGMTFIADGLACCDNPQYGTNKDYMKALLKQNVIVRKTRNNQFASNDKKDLRLGMSILPKLLEDMEAYSLSTLKEKLWKDEKDFIDFMKAFPEFCIPEKI